MARVSPAGAYCRKRVNHNLGFERGEIMVDDLDNSIVTEKISLEIPDQYLGLITLNRPKEMNPLNWAMVKSLRAVLEGFLNSREIRVIAFTGAGKAFSAGGDLKAYQALYRDEEAFRGFLQEFRFLNGAGVNAGV